FARLLPGENLFVHGASGGVGIAAVQIGRMMGARVVGTAGTERGRELGLREGAHHMLDHRAPGYMDGVARLTGGRGVDVILEMLANVNLGADLKILAPHGRVVVIGSRGDVQITPRDLMGRDGAIYAMTLWSTPPDELARIHSGIRNGLENGALRPVVGKEIPLGEAARAHREVMEPGAHGKIVLIP
ncbi:MAG: zinc-binding dehydrogenase, partial [Bryobacteraceae bacterium]